MKQVLAFWNLTKDDDKYKENELIGTITLEDGKFSISPEDSHYLQQTLDSHAPEELIDYYADRRGFGGTLSRLLDEDEEPTDFKIAKYEVIQHVPGKDGQVKESWTIDEEGVWHRDAKKS